MCAPPPLLQTLPVRLSARKQAGGKVVSKDGGTFYAFGGGKTRAYSGIGTTKNDARIACSIKGGKLSTQNTLAFSTYMVSTGLAAGQSPGQFSWTNALTKDVTSEDSIHGPFDNGQRDHTGTVSIPYAGKCKLSFTLWAMDTRDGERDRVDWNGKTIHK